jgi:exosortase/archaeosortase family protein
MKVNKDIRNILIKFAAFIIVLTLIRFIINSFISNLDIYQKTIISAEFKPIFSGMIALTGLVIIIVFGLLNREKLLKQKDYPTSLGDIALFGTLSLLSIMAYYLLRYFININIEFAKQNIIFFVLLLYLFIGLFPLFLLVAVFGKKLSIAIYQFAKKQIIWYVVGGVIIYVLLNWFQSLWIYMSRGVSESVAFLFRFFYSDVLVVDRVGGPLLRVEGFAATIGKQCSGIDSFFLFTALYIFIFILDYKKINKKVMILFYPIGALGMYITNIARIFLLYLTGIYISPDFAVGLFHQNIGWVLFIVYFSIFWYVISKKVYKTKSK